jgi:hypothetical protein
LIPRTLQIDAWLKARTSSATSKLSARELFPRVPPLDPDINRVLVDVVVVVMVVMVVPLDLTELLKDMDTADMVVMVMVTQGMLLLHLLRATAHQPVVKTTVGVVEVDMANTNHLLQTIMVLLREEAVLMVHTLAAQERIALTIPTAAKQIV